uniref:MarR family transcriptional regulator n=1 Tax=Agathobacter sp. TaxID=2021311 RepID=UPI00405797A9
METAHSFTENKSFPDKHLSEALLSSWLKLSTSINNSRIVSALSYNESLICSVLARHMASGQKKPLTATDLCRETKMLKSQMNRTLNQLEEKLMITRRRSTRDKRRVHILLNPEHAKAFQKQHQEILDSVSRIVDELGAAEAAEAAALFDKISTLADRVFSKKGE